MKIAIIGATGFIGSHLLAEAASRGHTITAFVSRPERVATTAQVSAQGVDVTDTGALTEALKGQGFEAVVSAFSGHAQADTLDYYLKGFKSILAAVKAAGVPRLLVVGGAATLEVAPGKILLDSPDFPAEWKGTAEGARQALGLLRDEPTLDWTFLSPSAMIEPGQRTGQFRLGGDQLLVDAQGKSHISLQDYAVALIDELDKPAHSRQRFTVGY
ncbi:NAD(P)-dependent oxidoreductase [Aquabacterium soli]|uniref:NAD(P)-dependent oxidoreductase n=1 Tax=Aquabacterium soli TaxID=2493092 RepID=A0A3R8S8E8_9BURK|nr:NAD(P)-dependent oxidoreductase [Aquabacterium soli]RRS03894.1 NAD(P)-dependent oxidoreductase [Aquabacterium soli]